MKIENIIKSKFDMEVASIKIIGEGYDSKAYLINGEYIFKFKTSSNKKKGYKKDNAEDYDNVQIPKNTDYNIELPKGFKQIYGDNIADQRKATACHFRISFRR